MSNVLPTGSAPAAPPPERTQPDNILKGIIYYTIAVFMVVAMNAFAKLATQDHHPVEIVFYRNLVILAVLIAYLSATRRWSVIKTERPRAHILRGVVGVVSVTLVFYAHKYLPMADATALMYAAPLIITALSGPLLKEKVGVYRWLAVLIGFCGVLVLAQPSGQGNATGYIFAFAAAGTIATVSLCIRDLGKTEDPVTTVFYFTVIGTIITGAFVPFIGTMPSQATIWVLFATGVAGTIQQFLKTSALAQAPASTLSPLQFTGLVWAALMGWFVFSDWPSMTIWIGSGIIIGSNLFIYWRERKKSKAP